MTTIVYLLRGGLWGWDGRVTSFGIDTLASSIKAAIPVADVCVYNWSAWTSCLSDLRNDTKAKGDRTVLIGYSGGGSRATWLADSGLVRVDLLIVFDPSPKWQMKPIQANVRKAVAFENSNPMMPSPFGALGGGIVSLAKGNGITALSTVTIDQQHLLVQFNQTLRDRSIAEIKAL